MIWNSIRRASLTLILAAGVSGQAVAQDQDQAPKRVYVFGGFEIEGGHAFYGDLGFQLSLNGNNMKDGFIASIYLGGAHWKVREAGIKVKGHQNQVEALIGYQWHLDNLYIATQFGIDYQHNKEKPSDPLSKIRGSKVGATLKLDVETTAVNAFFGSYLGSYSTANNLYYSRGRVGWAFSNMIKVGPEIAVYGDDDSDTFQFGAFVGDVKVLGNTYLTFSAGYSNHKGLSGIEDGVYATARFLTEF